MSVENSLVGSNLIYSPTFFLYYKSYESSNEKILFQIAITNGPNSTWHNTGLYSTAQYEHILVRHMAWHDKDAGWAICKILDTRTLKEWHIKRPTINIFYILIKANLKFYNFAYNLKLNLLIYFISVNLYNSFNS